MLSFNRNHLILTGTALLLLLVLCGFAPDALAADYKVSGNDTQLTTNSAIIGQVIERALIFIEHYKPVAYTMGGFGLICVAWGAIFGKMNWKWFANLAIGLFIMAYMGMIIDCFTRNHGVKRAQTAFSTTHIQNPSVFGDTLKEKSQADSGEFSSLVIEGETYDFNDYAEENDIDAEIMGDTLTMPEFDMTDEEIINSGAVAVDDDGGNSGNNSSPWTNPNSPWGGGGNRNPYLPM